MKIFVNYRIYTKKVLHGKSLILLYPREAYMVISKNKNLALYIVKLIVAKFIVNVNCVYQLF